MIRRGVGAVSYPELSTSSRHSESPTNPDITFEGIAANVKLLLKMIHEQSLASNIGGNLDDRRRQRVAGMIAILDDVKTRIQKYSIPVRKTLIKEFRRCNTDLRPQRSSDESAVDVDVVVIDEKEKLRRELHSSTSARKSLEAYVVAWERRRKLCHQNLLERFTSLMRWRNSSMTSKHKTRLCWLNYELASKTIIIWITTTTTTSSSTTVVVAALQDQNKALSDQLFGSLDRYRSLKGKYKDTKRENLGIQTTMEDIGFEVAQGLERLHGLKLQLATQQVQTSDIEKEISELQCMFQSFNMKILRLQMQIKV